MNQHHETECPFEDSPARLAATVGALRAARGFEAAHLAIASGLSPETITAIESGQEWPSCDVVDAVARALLVPLTALVALRVV